MDTEAEVIGLIAEELGSPSGVGTDTRLADLVLPEVERIADLLVILEQRFGFQFSTREIDQIITVGDLAECLRRKMEVSERPGFW